ncbi:3-oxoacyl-[acyl-carrier-protein] synthase III C-terminal domain-containing protein [Flavobacterium buctense]|uniref:3-oxoacyl-[acyl-carrier-protein] synthase III C-terminal domain-containing protein n=1 Tax=Flavobacterium buctense TaxID=1648146 RepID=A0ABU9E2U0_9FLAO|nr:3-oxoacyl-[acyl-carrier-protein] synthase III C-terminal domain-containing protein [Flavobacterium buctense]
MSFYQFNNVKISGIASAIPKQARSVDLQTASDLGYAAAIHLLETKNIDRTQLGFIIFLTKTPDYRSPASAIVLQHRLGLPLDCLAYDINLGSVGFIAGLQLGCSLLNGLNTTKGLVIIGDTNSKQLAEDHSHYTDFGDAATAVLLEKKEASLICLQSFSQGDAYDAYLIPGGAFRTNEKRALYDLSSLPTAGTFNQLQYDKETMHQFFAEKIPGDLTDFMAKSNTQSDAYDLLAFQQTYPEMNLEIIEKNGFDSTKLVSNLKKIDDCSGSSIPLLLLDVTERKRVLSCAYGEGLSWGFADFYLEAATVLPIIETDDYFTEGFVTHDI